MILLQRNLVWDTSYSKEVVQSYTDKVILHKNDEAILVIFKAEMEGDCSRRAFLPDFFSVLPFIPASNWSSALSGNALPDTGDYFC